MGGWMLNKKGPRPPLVPMKKGPRPPPVPLGAGSRHVPARNLPIGAPQQLVRTPSPERQAFDAGVNHPSDREAPPEPKAFPKGALKRKHGEMSGSTQRSSTSALVPTPTIPRHASTARSPLVSPRPAPVSDMVAVPPPPPPHRVMVTGRLVPQPPRAPPRTKSGKEPEAQVPRSAEHKGTVRDWFCQNCSEVQF